MSSTIEPDVATDVAVHGTVDPRFQPVVDVVTDAISRGEEVGSALSIYIDGSPVVDMWCGTANGGAPWQRDTLTNIFSAGKGVVALLAQLLVDRSELDVDQRVTHYWPE